MAKSVTGGRGVTGINWSGKENRLDSNTTTINRVPGYPYGNPFAKRTAPPRTYVPAPKPPAKKPPVAVVKPPAKKPTVKPVSVISNVTRERLSPVQAKLSARPMATRFGTVTGKMTGTRVSGGAGYGGGGTRGEGSLSGQGSGSRSAGTSRTGGTQRNDPVRG